ncbi:MAG: hypothetical protein ACC653_03320 [Gammaproteobacteria bacterium]
MKKQIKSLVITSSSTVLFFFSGYALAQVSHDFKIETVKSSKVNISGVNLLKITEGYVVNGKVSNKGRHRRLTIPGHVDISILDVNGKSINTTETAIYRVNKKSRYAKFKQTLNQTPVKGNTIRVAHHNAPLGVKSE